MFTNSLWLDDRHVMAAKQVIEGEGDKRLNVHSRLRLNHAEAAFKVRMEISPNVNLPLAAWRFDRLGGRSRSHGDRFGRGRGDRGALASARAFKLFLHGREFRGHGFFFPLLFTNSETN